MFMSVKLNLCTSEFELNIKNKHFFWLRRKSKRNTFVNNDNCTQCYQVSERKRIQKCDALDRKYVNKCSIYIDDINLMQNYHIFEIHMIIILLTFCVVVFILQNAIQSCTVIAQSKCGSKFLSECPVHNQCQ